MESRTQNSLRNIKHALLNALVTAVIPFITRTVFIRILGKDYLGIDAVFLNIINLIEIVNIGIGSAITYSVYKLIADQDNERCRTLFRLYRNCYYTMGVIVLAIGVALVPFLDVILKNKPNIPENTTLIYLIILSGVVSFYFVADKQCVINAHQKNYMVTRIRTIVVTVINLVEIALLFWTRNYMVYLILQTSQNIIIYSLVYIKAIRSYPEYFRRGKVNKLAQEDRQVIVKNTVALVFNRAGSLLINCTDNFIIASFVGVVSSGLYSNYLVIKNILNTFTALFTQSLTASIGNLNAEGNKKRLNEIFDQVYFINYMIHAFCSICFFCLIEPFIRLWVGDAYCMGLGVAAIVTINFYILGIQKTAEQFKAACGLYWQDRFRVFIEAILNLIISIILVQRLGVLGVLLGTFISDVLVTFWVEPLIVFRHALKRNVMAFYGKTILYLLITGGLTCLIHLLNEMLFAGTGGVLWFGCRLVATCLSAVLSLCLIFVRNRHFRAAYRMGMHQLMGMLHRVK